MSSTSTSVAQYDVRHLRETEFPIANQYAYLNHAGIAPIPQRTFQAMREFLEKMANQTHLAYPVYTESIEPKGRKAIQSLINAASSDEIIGVQSTTLGIGLLALAIDWRAGQNIVLANVEYPANAYPWMGLADQFGIDVRQIPAEHGGLTLGMVERSADKNTRLVAASAVQFLSGHRTDLKAIGEFCRSRNILFVVDGIQAVGLVPIDVQAMNIDMLVSGGQKSLMAPPGAGFLYARTEVAEQLRPRLVSSSATVDFIWYLNYDMTFRPGVGRFTMGTENTLGLVGLAESAAMLNELGVPAINAHVTALADYAIAQIGNHGYDVITPEDHASIVTFRLGVSVAEAQQIVDQLRDRGVVAVKHLDAKGNTHLRISFHCYNTRDDIDRFIAALKEIRG